MHIEEIATSKHTTIGKQVMQQGILKVVCYDGGDSKSAKTRSYWDSRRLEYQARRKETC